MILTSEQISKRNIAVPANPAGRRPTTYDATVGTIISKEGVCDSGQYILKPRGIVWLVSNEIFTIPSDITGLATLRTRWTNRGVLALTLGIVDPGWSGPLSTSVINFSKNDFTITTGDPCFRLIFLQHDTVDAPSEVHDAPGYVRQVFAQTGSYSDTFLTIDTLAPEIADRIFGLPRLAFWIGMAALVLAVIAIFAPIAMETWSNHLSQELRLQSIEGKVADLENASKPLPEPRS